MGQRAALISRNRDVGQLVDHCWLPQLLIAQLRGTGQEDHGRGVVAHLSPRVPYCVTFLLLARKEFLSASMPARGGRALIADVHSQLDSTATDIGDGDSPTQSEAQSLCCRINYRLALLVQGRIAQHRNPRS